MDGRTQEAALWKGIDSLPGTSHGTRSTLPRSQSALLEAMGTTIEQARRTIWLAKINVDDGPELVLKKVVRAVNRIKTDLTLPEYAAKEIFKGFLIHHFSEETLMMLEAHKEETTHQQIQTLQRLWQSKDLYAKRRMLRNDPYRLSRPAGDDETVDLPRTIGLLEDRTRPSSIGRRVSHRVVGMGVVVGLLGRDGAVKGVPGGVANRSIMGSQKKAQ